MASVEPNETVLEVQALTKKLVTDQPFTHRSYPVNANWASQLGHPCERFLYHNRKDWEQRQSRDWKGIGIRGNLIADWWRRYMSEKGYTVIEAERPLSQALREKYQISGKIDGRIGSKGIKPKLYEFKTMAEYEYKKINTYEDIAESHKDYIRMYIAQIQTYLYDMNEEAGLFVICNASTLEWKVIVVYLDFGYCEWLLQRADRVNRAVTASEPPDRIPYGKTCKRCDFANICLPDIRNDGLEVRDEAHLLELIKTVESLKATNEEYEAAAKEARDIATEIGKDCIVGGEYKVELKKITTRRVNTKAMPIEVRSQYEIESTQTRVEFIPLGQV